MYHNQTFKKALHAVITAHWCAELYAIHDALYKHKQVVEYRGLDEDMSRELSTLKSSREKRQKNAFLDRFTIRQAQTPGIGPAKTAMLASFGIETAADVTNRRCLLSPVFGEVMTAKMLAWRRVREAKFRYMPLLTRPMCKSRMLSNLAMLLKR
jgi:DNA-binding helix-hairpin-helix protein with protein kinase domain